MTLDVEHYTAEEKEKIAASYAAHDRDARTKSIPTLGSKAAADSDFSSSNPNYPPYRNRWGKRMAGVFRRATSLWLR